MNIIVKIEIFVIVLQFILWIGSCYSDKIKRRNAICFCLFSILMGVMGIISAKTGTFRGLVAGTIVSFLFGMRIIPFVQTIIVIIGYKFIMLIISGVISAIINRIYPDRFDNLFYIVLCVWSTWVAIKNLVYTLEREY